MQDKLTNEDIILMLRSGGDKKELMGELYRLNKPFIYGLVKSLIRDVQLIEDGMQEAYLGLCEAADTYKPEKGFKFITFARYPIAKAVKRGLYSLQHNGGESINTEAQRIIKIKNELYQTLHRIPTKAEIALQASVSVKRLDYIINTTSRSVSLSAPFKSTDLIIADTIPDNYSMENEAADRSERESVRNAVRRLPKRESQIIRLYFFEGLTQPQIAREMHISSAMVSLIMQKAFELLRRPNMRRLIFGDELDNAIPYHRHRGLKAYNNSFVSATESAVFKRELLKYKAERRFKSLGQYKKSA